MGLDLHPIHPNRFGGNVAPPESPISKVWKLVSRMQCSYLEYSLTQQNSTCNLGDLLALIYFRREAIGAQSDLALLCLKGNQGCGEETVTDAA